MVATTIDVDAPVVTLVNVFTVHPDRQEELVSALDRSSREVFLDVPGFVSANLHRSLDGTRVVNYAQWADERAFAAMQERPEIRAHMAEIAAIADGFEPHLYAVAAVHRAG